MGGLTHAAAGVLDPRIEVVHLEHTATPHHISVRTVPQQAATVGAHLEVLVGALRVGGGEEHSGAVAAADAALRLRRAQTLAVRTHLWAHTHVNRPLAISRQFSEGAKTRQQQ